jgi:pyruvate dehydrogenase E2 component (dihydrolipoamide acetyltransferase)
MNVLMPQLGETVAEGRITKWFKAEGDNVAPGDNLFEIETDKTAMEVPSTTTGVIAEIRSPVGTVVPVGAIVAVIAGDGAVADDVPTHAPLAARPPPAEAIAASASAAPSPPQPILLDPFRAVRTPERNYGPARQPSGAVASPLARRLAAEGGIDLTQVRASGAHGRILARDVENARAAAPTPPATLAADGVKALHEGRPYEEVPLDAMRRAIATQLLVATQTVPHFHLSTDVDFDRLEEIRAEANGGAVADAEGRPSFRLTINDFVVKALAVALQRVPDANVVWAEDRIIKFSASDIAVAVAVALESGLITPIVRSAETKSVIAISAELKDLAARARDRRLDPREYQGGVTTVSNLGMYAVREFSAIINPPQSTILAVGAAGRRPVETPDGGFRFVSQATVTLACDHRVIDGALAARLLAAFKHAIEHPIALML